MQRGHSYRLRMFQFTYGASALNLIRLDMIYGFTYCMILQEFQRTNLTTCRSCPRCAHGLGQQFVPVPLGSPPKSRLVHLFSHIKDYFNTATSAVLLCVSLPFVKVSVSFQQLFDIFSGTFYVSSDQSNLRAKGRYT